jgi:hypothetical protein
MHADHSCGGRRAACISFKAADTAASTVGAGQKEKARHLVEQLKALPATTNVSPYDLAKIYAALGEKENALSAIESAWQTHTESVFTLPYDPLFDPVRNDPRVQKILASLPSSPR